MYRVCTLRQLFQIVIRVFLGVHEQNSVMAYSKSKINICTESHLTNNNHPCLTLKTTLNHFTNYNSALYFIQLKHCAHFAHVLTDHTEASRENWKRVRINQICSPGGTVRNNV